MRRTWILVAILCCLLPVAATVSYLRFRARAEQEAHWNRMFERGYAYAAANGGRSDGAPFTPMGAPAAPIAVIRPGAAAEFQQIELPWEDSQGTRGMLGHIDGCLQVGDGRDLLWQGAELFLATAPDKLRRIWKADEPDCEFGERATVCFDGRYAWALVHRAERSPRLFIVDPQSGQIWQYTAADGSLSAIHDLTDAEAREFRLALAPLSPGRVCAIIKPWTTSPAVEADEVETHAESANTFWLGTLDFEAPDRRAATRIPAPAAIQLFAWPVEMYALNDGPERRVVVSRGGGYPHLIVAPDLRRIDVAKTAPSDDIPPSLTAVQYSAHDGAIWRIKSLRSLNNLLAGNGGTSILGTPALMRAALPDLEEQPVLRQGPVGMLLSRDASLYIIGEHCWRLGGSGAELEKIADEPPWQFDDYLNSNAIATTIMTNGNGASPSVNISFSKPPPPAGRDPFVARSVFTSNVFGILISASSPVSSGAADTVLYQLKIRARSNTN